MPVYLPEAKPLADEAQRLHNEILASEAHIKHLEMADTSELDLKQQRAELRQRIATLNVLREKLKPFIVAP
jgi:hypothetical protein